MRLRNIGMAMGALISSSAALWAPAASAGVAPGNTEVNGCEIRQYGVGNNNCNTGTNTPTFRVTGYVAGGGVNGGYGWGGTSGSAYASLWCADNIGTAIRIVAGPIQGRLGNTDVLRCHDTIVMNPSRSVCGPAEACGQM